MTHRVEQLAEGKVTLHCGDCLTLLATLDANSIDACVTDPPYGLGREPDPLVMLRAWLDGGHYSVKSKSGFMGKEWDAFVPQPAIWKQVFRVLKPGASVLAFFGTRTYDLGVLAMRLAGFEVRDSVSWLFGSGFPKSLDVSKAIDKAAGAEREVIGITNRQVGPKGSRRVDGLCGSSTFRENPDNPGNLLTAPATDDALAWSGFGTALKPAVEPIVLARKPLSESTVAANVLRWGCGSLNIDGCRVHAYESSNSRRSRETNGQRHSSDEVQRLRQADAEMEVLRREGEESSDVQSEMQIGSNVGIWQSELARRAMDRQADWISEGPIRDTIDGGQESVSSSTTGSARTSIDNGSTSRPPAPANGDGSPHQRGEGGQSDREPCDDGLGGARQGASEDRADNVGTGSTESHIADATRRASANGREGEISANRRYTDEGSTNFAATPGPRGGSPTGRWPANLIHDGSDEVVGAFPETVPGSDAVRVNKVETQFGFGNGRPEGRLSSGFADNGGSAARFFYTAKADADDRLGSKHPTVKPLDLIQYLCRLVCPPKGIVLDPFAGTGTTGEAAFREGMRAVLIEREPEYQADIIRRMSLCMSSRAERAREGAKARYKDKPVDMGPLFGGTAEAIGGGRMIYGVFADEKSGRSD